VTDLIYITTAGWLQFALLVAALAVCYVPLGNYIAHIFTTDKDWAVERGDRGGASRPARTDAGPARKLEHRLICRSRDRCAGRGRRAGRFHVRPL
jgi:hypothetical protein